jgi:hypothetical protein
MVGQPKKNSNKMSQFRRSRTGTIVQSWEAGVKWCN